MVTYRPTTDFITPPENRGQLVTLSYALDEDAGVIIERTHDASDGNVAFRAYAYPDDESWDWAPWNHAPALGDDLGPCLVADR